MNNLFSKTKYKALWSVFFVLFSVSTIHAESNPPIAHCTNDCVNNAATYDFSGFDIPFAVNWPTAPNTDSADAPSSISAIQSAVSMNGNLVTIAPGTYNGNISIGSADDVDVIANGVTINGNLTIGTLGSGSRPSRIRWSGGTVNGVFVFAKGTDFLVNNLHVINSVGGGTPQNWTGGPGDGASYSRERFAMINSTIEIRNASSTGGWAIFMFDPASGARSDRIAHTDWIMANVIINSNAQNFRVGGFERGIFVDVYWNSDAQSANGPRWENAITDLFIGRSIAVDSTIVGPGSINRATIEDWSRYHSLNNIYSNMFDAAVGSIVNNSSFYDSGNGPFGNEMSLGQANGSNNITSQWNGSSLPSDATYGADH